MFGLDLGIYALITLALLVASPVTGSIAYRMKWGWLEGLSQVITLIGVAMLVVGILHGWSS